MKNRKLTLIASVILVIAMLFGTMTAGATDSEITTTTEVATTEEITTTTEVATTLTEETTTEAPAEPTTTTEPTTELTTAPADETTTVPEETTTADSYYDDSDYESEEEKEAYDEGYWDGYEDGWDDAKEEYEGEDYDSGYDDGWDDGYDWGESDGYYDGYDDGYYEGYYDAIQDMENKDVITIFDRWDAFIEDLRERVEDFLYRIKDFFQKIFKTGDYAPQEPVDPDDSGFIPGYFENTLVDDENAKAVCNEFNDLVNNFIQGAHEDVNITKTVDVDVQANDLPQVVQAIVQPVIENFLVSDSSTIFFYEGDWTNGVQSTKLMPQFLTVAEKTVNEDGTTDYRFEVIEEAAYYDGYETRGVRKIDGEIYYYTLQHEYIADALYVEYGYLDPVTITSAKITYPGATVTAKTDAQGRLIKYDINMPVEGEATGKIGMIRASVVLSGHRNEGFTMDYDV